MGYIQAQEEITADIKERADIVQIIGECVELKRSGVRFLGLCPFHGEKTPSFSVHSGQQFFYCFGCGESGDVFSFMMKYYNLDFPGAIKELARRYQVELPEKPLSRDEQKKREARKLMYAVSEKAAHLYTQYLQHPKFGKQAREYLNRRAIPLPIQKKFGVGYAPSVESAGWEFLKKQLNDREIRAAEAVGLLVKKDTGGWYDRFRDRIVFPIYDVSGKVCGFGGRIVGEGQPKYLNSPESPIFSKSKSLLGLFQQQESIRQKRQVVLVEGNFDMISLVVHGCENVAAPLGTALTRTQVRLLHRFAEEAILLFDGDEAGLKAAVRCVPHFFAEQVRGKVAVLPTGHDPDTFVREQGVGALQKLLDQAEGLPEFVLAQLVKEHGLSLDGKSRIVEELRPLVKAASSALQRSLVIAHFSEQLGIPVEQLTASLSDEIHVTSPVKSIQPKTNEQVTPLTAAQKKLVSFMLMNPTELKKLEEAGIRELLAGGIGEILFLQMKLMVKDGQEVEPEELLSLLPGGAERTLVADLLLSASSFNSSGIEGNDDREDLVELLGYLKKEKLQGRSKQVSQRLVAAQEKGDFEQVEQLLREKLEVERELREG